MIQQTKYGRSSSHLGILLFSFIVALLFVGTYVELNFIVARIISPLFAIIVFVMFLQRPVQMPKEFFFYSLFILWCLTGYLVAINRTAFWGYWTLILQINVLFLCFVFLVSRIGHVNHVFAALLTVSVLLLVRAFFDPSLEFDLGQENAKQLSIERTGPNAIGYLMMAGFFAIAFFFERARTFKWRMVLGGAAFCLSCGLVWAASRKAFMTSLLFFGLWLTMCYIRNIWEKPGRIFVIGLLVVFVTWGTNFVLDNTFLGMRMQQYESVETLYEKNKRFKMMAEGWSMFLSSPVIGVGLAQYAIHSSFGKYAHSDFFEVLSTTGAVGTLIYLGFYIVLWTRLAKLRRRLRSKRYRYDVNLLRAIFICVVVIGLGRPNFLDIYAMILLSILVGYSYFIELRILPEEPCSAKQKRRSIELKPTELRVNVGGN